MLKSLYSTFLFDKNSTVKYKKSSLIKSSSPKFFFNLRLILINLRLNWYGGYIFIIRFTFISSFDWLFLLWALLLTAFPSFSFSFLWSLLFSKFSTSRVFKVMCPFINSSHISQSLLVQTVLWFAIHSVINCCISILFAWINQHTAK